MKQYLNKKSSRPHHRDIKDGVPDKKQTNFTALSFWKQ